MFGDDDATAIWLSKRTLSERLTLGARTALRALPAIVAANDAPPAFDRRLLALTVLRATFVAAVASQRTDDDVLAAVQNATFSDDCPAYKSEIPSAAYATACAADFALSGNHVEAVLDYCMDAAGYTAKRFGDFNNDFSSDFSSPQTATENARTAAVTAIEADGSLLESVGNASGLFRLPLWPADAPTGLAEDWKALSNDWTADSAFVFWRRWFEGCLKGRDWDWSMLLKIALIKQEVWDAGPDAVAKAIEEIEAEFAPVAPPPAVVAQTRVLDRDRLATEAMAGGLSAQVDDGITALLRLLQLNELPEELRGLVPLRDAARRIERLAAEANEAEFRINALEVEITNMHRALADVTVALNEARKSPDESVFWIAARRRAGESVGDWKLWGAVAAGGLHLLGYDIAGGTVAKLLELIKAARGG